MDKKPMVALDLKGPGGNTVAIVGQCMKAAKGADWPEKTIEAMKDEMISGDRAHVLDVLFECFEVNQVHYVYTDARREEME